MNRWPVLVLVTVALVALALTAGWWLPPLLSFVGANSDVIQGLTDLVQLVLWAGAGVAALLGLWQGRRKARSERPGVQHRANVEGPGAVAQGGSVAVGKDGQAVVGSTVGGDILGRGARKEVHIHDGTPRPDEKTLLMSYLNRLVDEVRWLNLGGVDPALVTDAGRARLSLARVYIELDTLKTERLERARPGVVEEMREPRRVPVVEVMDGERHLALLGDPGSGKSTFINFVTLCLAGEGLGLEEVNLSHLGEAWTHGWLLPVRVVLRDFVARGLPPVREKATGDHLWCFLKAELGETLADFTPLFYKHLQEKGGLVLLDGFDEVPEAGQRRQQVMDAAQGFARDFPRCRFLLTSRTYAWQRQAWRLPGFVETVLAPFNDEQIETFVDRWYAHVSTLRRGEMSAEEAQGRATLLKYAIEHTPGLRELARRPLLLTLMASLHAWRGGSLPEKRERLYNDTLDLLLNVWEQPKVVRDARGNEVVVQPAVREWLQAPRDRLLKALERMGYEAHAGQPALEGTADVPEAQLVQALWEVRGNPDLRRERIVEYIRDRAGLLVPRGVGVYTFAHRTFQEYLAARYLTEKDWPGPMAGLVLEKPERWREVALLAAAKAARGSSYAVWGLVEALAPKPPPEVPDPRAGWAALIGAAALVENGLQEHVPPQHREKVARLQRWLVTVLEKALLPPVERAAAGRTLAKLGDPRPGVGVSPPHLPPQDWGGLRGGGERFSLPDILWCYVPPGPFVMGDGKEQHRNESITEGYLISRYPITNAQFRAFVKAGGYRERRYWVEAEQAGVWAEGEVKAWRDDQPREGPYDYGEPFNLPNHPVVGVTWYEAVAFCRWLEEQSRIANSEWRIWKEGCLGILDKISDDGLRSAVRDSQLVLRLPSEAEWEKAARGDDGPRFPWGDEEDSGKANHDETGIGTTSAVGCFPGGASPYGVEDLSGNVWEWTRSLWGRDWEKPEFGYPYDPGDGREDMGAGRDVARVLRGGAFYDGAGGVRCACRRRNDPNSRWGYNGFRVVASPVHL